jgi:hypothetical protein
MRPVREGSIVSERVGRSGGLIALDQARRGAGHQAG